MPSTGTFYMVQGNGPNGGKVAFGSDVDNFYSANNYSVYKPSGRILEYIVNFKEDGGVIGGEGDAHIGEVRYSSTIRILPKNPCQSTSQPSTSSPNEQHYSA